MQQTRIRSEAVVEALIEINRIFEEFYEYEKAREFLKQIDPEFLRMADTKYVPSWVTDFLGVLTRLYNHGYQDSINDIQNMK